jgi:hypothetical protein
MEHEPKGSVLGALREAQNCLTSGQTHIESLITFLRERSSIEEAYARSLQRLCKSTLSLDGS